MTDKPVDAVTTKWQEQEKQSGEIPTAEFYQAWKEGRLKETILKANPGLEDSDANKIPDIAETPPQATFNSSGKTVWENQPTILSSRTTESGRVIQRIAAAGQPSQIIMKQNLKKSISVSTPIDG